MALKHFRIRGCLPVHFNNTCAYTLVLIPKPMYKGFVLKILIMFCWHHSSYELTGANILSTVQLGGTNTRTLSPLQWHPSFLRVYTVKGHRGNSIAATVNLDSQLTTFWPGLSYLNKIFCKTADLAALSFVSYLVRIAYVDCLVAGNKYV